MSVYDNSLASGRRKYNVGIIGAGAAGIAAAKSAVQIGCRAILIEKSERHWGGNFHSGCVSSKALIRSAEVWSLARRAEEFGLPKLELPPVCMDQLTKRLGPLIKTIREKDSPEHFRSLDVEVKFGEARFKDNQTVLLDGECVTAGAWIIATGSRPAIPEIEGLEEVPYWTTEIGRASCRERV